MTIYPASFIFSRREIRSLVLQALCEYDSVDHDATQVLERILNEREVKGAIRGFAHDIVGQVLQNFPAVDNIIGDLAPDFVAYDENGKGYRLRDFRNKRNVVLSFYPMDMTPG